MNRFSKWVPRAVVDEIRLRRSVRAHPTAAYIRSADVSAKATLGLDVGIGEDVVVNDGVRIGDYSYVNRGSLIISGSIGKFCSIAHLVQIGAERHPLEHLSTSPFMYGSRSVVDAKVEFDEIYSPPRIGNDVWIGSAAIVQQGVHIGDGAIIAAGAVVTKDVAPYSIHGGVPAIFLRKRFDDDVVAELIDSRWWDWHPDHLKELRACVESAEHWLEAFRAVRQRRAIE